MINVGQQGVLPFDMVMNDAWDGYNTERKELMGFLRDNSIRNVVSITGDVHAQFAGTVDHDYDDANPVPAVIDLVVAGIASNSLFSFFEGATRPIGGVLRSLITYDSTPLGGTDRFVNNMNVTLRYGVASALAARLFGRRRRGGRLRGAVDELQGRLLSCSLIVRGVGSISIPTGGLRDSPPRPRRPNFGYTN
jgi:hypothetical protein